MTALTRLCPRKLSRTSTQAMRVPTTAFTRATASAASSVSFSAATASGAEIESQNVAPPARVDRQTTAASGRTTTRPRYATTKPRARAAETAAPGSLARGRATAPASAASVATHLSLDLREDPAPDVEELLLHLRPSAEPELVDPEEAWPRRELPRELPGHALHGGPVEVLGEDLLRRGRPQVAHERVRLARVRR